MRAGRRFAREVHHASQGARRDYVASRQVGGARVKLALHVARRAKTWREYTAALDAFAWLFDR
jgi:hypothetical protein